MFTSQAHASKVLAVKTIHNDFFRLTLLPNFGCHWVRLEIKHRQEWIDLLYPVHNVQDLLLKPSGVGSFIMAPWANRIPQGTFSFGNCEYQLIQNFPDQSAIHGDVRTRPWEVGFIGEGAYEASLDSRRFHDFNFPFSLKFFHTVELLENRIRIGFFIQNSDTKKAPVGFGFHPYFFRCLPGYSDEVQVRIPARKIYPACNLIPIGNPVAVEGKNDFQTFKPLGTPNLDDCYTDLSDYRYELLYQQAGLKAELRVDPIFQFVVFYVPGTNEQQSEPFFSIEPMTHVINALNFDLINGPDSGLRALKMGEIWGGFMDLTVHSTSF